MSIYKIFQVNKENKIIRATIFLANNPNHNADELNELYSRDPTNILFNKIFGAQMMTELSVLEKTNIAFVNDAIYSDDTIENIKFKIMTQWNICFDEIYLYAKTNKLFNSVDIYNQATENGGFTNDMMRTLLLNYDIDLSLITQALDKEQLTYNDLFSLNVDNNELEYTIPIGIDYNNFNNFIASNPFMNINYSDYLLANIDNLLSTNNHLLLFHYGNLNHNSLYVCLAEDLLEHSDVQGLSYEETIHLYYPFLYEKNIFTKALLDEYKKTIVIDKSIQKYNKSIDALYDIERTIEPFPVLNEGIHAIHFVIHSKTDINLPLDLIFKLIHATKSNPFIVYNPGKSIENIYKLYSNEYAENGKKIPYLSKNIIFKLMRTFKKPECVSIYINDIFSNGSYTLQFDITKKGHIHVSGDFEQYLDIELLEEIIIRTINPIIKQIQGRFDDNKLIFQIFDNFDNPQVELIDLHYNYIWNISKRFSLLKYVGCLSGVFNIIEQNVLNGIKMRFKRVANYNEMNGIEAFLTELIDKQIPKDEIVYALEMNYKLTNEEAKEKFVSFLSSAQILQSQNENKVLKLKNNPGFKIEINVEQNLRPGYQINVGVTNINHIQYLNTIPIYIKSLIKLTQDRVNKPEIMQLCKSKTALKTAEIIEDIDDTGRKGAFQLDRPDFDLNFLMDDDESSDEEYEGEMKSEELSGGSDLDLNESLDDLDLGDESDDELDKSPMGDLNLDESLDGSLGDLNIDDILSDDAEEETDKVGKESEPEADDEQSEPEAEDEQSEPEADDEQSEPEADELSESISDADAEDSEDISEYEYPQNELETLQPENIAENDDFELDSDLESLDMNDEDSEDAESIVFDDMRYNINTGEYGSPSHYLFCYGSNDKTQLIERLKRTNIEPKKAKLDNYIRIFGDHSENWQGATASLISSPGNYCMGSYISVNNKDIQTMDKFEGVSSNKSTQISVTILNEKNKEISAIAYVLVNDTWTNHPNIKYLYACCLTLIPFWPELESNQELLVKNNNEILMGIYNYKENNYSVIEEEEMEPQKVSDIQLHPNPFFKRKKQLDPKLFFSKDDEKFGQYSRSCPWNVRRQPVILTQQEKDKIDNGPHKGSYESAIKHGSTKDNQYWYICPRFWSFKDNTSLRADEVNPENLIPHDAVEVTDPNKTYIYEFVDKTGNYGNYKHPGYLDPTKHPDGLCAPCCFKTNDSKLQKKRAQQCKDILLNKDVTEDVKFDKKIGTTEKYIMSHDKFPLQQNRWGHLPIIIQKFLSFDSSKCEGKDKKSLKHNTPCLLRHGVENNQNQSFIACISALYIDFNSKKERLSISEMKDKIITTLSIDNILQFHNGNIVNIFAESNYDSIDISPYTSSKLYSKIYSENPHGFKKVVSGFTNFIKYLKDDNVVINHTYLWDIVCSRNADLFPKGLNLIIMENKNADITNNVHVLCPSNQYSSQVYTRSKPTGLIYKEGSFYEPIYITNNEYIEKPNTKPLIKYTTYYTIDIKDFSLIPGLYNFITKIMKHQADNCMPKNTSNDVYTFKTNITLIKLLELLKNDYTLYSIKKLVLHYDNRVIGVIAESKKTKASGYIPCAPSALLPELNNDSYYELINDTMWQSYANTLHFLALVNKETNIPCLPRFKVMDNELIVGILTETNLFIPLDTPEPLENTHDDLEVLTDKNYILEDKKQLIYGKEDVIRVKGVQMIRLERQFYYAFRKLSKYLLNQFKFFKDKLEIQKLIEDDSTSYINKITYLVSLLQNLTKKYVDFVDSYSEDILLEISNLEWCNEDCDDLIYCSTTNEIACKLLIPKFNLVTGQDNVMIYYNRFADELIRYKIIQGFVFDPTSQLFHSDIDYQLSSNEILIIQSFLTQDYFLNLNKTTTSKYEKHLPSDFIYSDKLKKLTLHLNHKDLLQENIMYEAPIHVKYSKFFIDKVTITFIPFSKHTSFDSLAYVISEQEAYKKQEITVNHVKKMLISAYQTYMGEYSTQLMNTLKKEGKKEYPEKVISGEITIETMIHDDLYYLTPLDILLISSEYNIPILIILEYINIDTILILDKFIDSNKFYIYASNTKDTFSLLKTNIDHVIDKILIKDPLFENIKQQNMSLIHYIDS